MPTPAYAVLTSYWRGSRSKQETIKALFALRTEKNAHTVDSYIRIIKAVRYG